MGEREVEGEREISPDSPVPVKQTSLQLGQKELNSCVCIPVDHRLPRLKGRVPNELGLICKTLSRVENVDEKS